MQPLPSLGGALYTSYQVSVDFVETSWVCLFGKFDKNRLVEPRQARSSNLHTSLPEVGGDHSSGSSSKAFSTLGFWPARLQSSVYTKSSCSLANSTGKMIFLKQSYESWIRWYFSSIQELFLECSPTSDIVCFANPSFPNRNIGDIMGHWKWTFREWTTSVEHRIYPINTHYGVDYEGCHPKGTTIFPMILEISWIRLTESLFFL